MIDETIYAPDKTCVFDAEGTYGSYLNRTCSPFSEGETALCSAGFLLPTGYRDVYFVKPLDGRREGIQRGTPEWLASFPDLTGVRVLVGHNIKFDLLWYWRHPNLELFLKNGGVIWDTFYAEFLLSGQLYRLDSPSHLVPSLENVAKRRGCTRKQDVVAAMWEAGVRTEDIQEQILLEYQKGDCQTTLEIYELQVAQAVRQNQLHMIHWRMDGLLATTEMEFNGLLIDVNEAENQLAELEIVLEEKTRALDKFIPENLPEELEFNWNSTAHLSALIFGGEIKYKAPAVKINEDGSLQYYKKKIRKYKYLPDGSPDVVKSGKNAGLHKSKLVDVCDIERGPKTRIEPHYFELSRQATPKEKWKGADDNKWSTAQDVLEEVAKQGIELVAALLDKRGLEKDIGTYYRRFHKGKWTGMLTMVHPDCRVHHSLNHSTAKTTRLSCTKPNLQNLTKKGKSRVRAMFISRFGSDGRVVEGDYSQLEVVCKGVLSGDQALLDALANNVDFHCDWLSLSPAGEGKTYAEVVHLCKIVKDAIWKAKRQTIKPLTFGEAYGAGIPSLAEETGMDAEDVEAAIKARMKKYPAMYQYDADNIEKVKASRRLSPLFTDGGHRAGIGYLRAATDTIYSFIESDSPPWMQKRGIMTSFTPTRIKNYPSQGLGGEIMQVSLGRLFRWILTNDRFDDKLLMTNTVHDCCWFDVHNDYMHHVGEAKRIMEDVSPFFNANYPSVDWNTPFPTEFEAGPSMYELEDLHF